MAMFERMKKETFVIGWSDAILMLLAGAGLGAIMTIMIISILA